MRQLVRSAALASFFLLPAVFGVAVQGCGSNATNPTDMPDSGAGGAGAAAGGAGPAAGGTGIDAPGPTGQGGSGEPDVLPATVCPIYTPVALTGATTFSSFQPSIIWTGSNYLVVWSSAPRGVKPVAGNIMSALLTPEGIRVGADNMVADTANNANSPEVVALPGATPSYAVVFEDCEGCVAGTTVNSVILGADGIATAAPVPVSPTAVEQRRPYVAAGLGGVYATFRDVVPAAGAVPAHTVARLVKLNAQGAPEGPGVVVDEASDGHYPHLALGPDRLALVYQRNRVNPANNKNDAQVVLALFDPALTLQKEVVLRIGVPHDATNPVVQWNTSRWVVAWEDERDEGNAQIYATVVDADGSRTGPVGCVGAACDPEPAYNENGNWPAIASGNLMTSLIGFYGYPGQHVLLARVEASGKLKPGQVVLGVGKYPSIAYNDKGAEYAVVYEDTASERVMFARFKCAD